MPTLNPMHPRREIQVVNMRNFTLPLAALLCTIAGHVLGEGGTTVPPVRDQATLKECGACHIPYPPQMLPARSWKKILASLADHFGENATLPDASRRVIEAYLRTHAGDAPNSGGHRFMRGIAPEAMPLRITDTRFWKRRHSEVSAAAFTSAKVKSKADCAACHVGAAQGQFGEEE
jgi:hypothetical protein